MFGRDTQKNWSARLAAADIPSSPVNTMAEGFADPQMVHRKMLQTIDHPVEGRIPQLGFPIKFSATPGTLRSPPPLLGEHNSQVLRSLGYGEQRIAELGAQGVL